jgi:hypothetical protein
MAARVLAANATPSVWFRTDLGSVVTDNQTNGSGNYTMWADGVLWDNTNSKAIPPEHINYTALASTPKS